MKCFLFPFYNKSEPSWPCAVHFLVQSIFPHTDQLSVIAKATDGSRFSKPFVKVSTCSTLEQVWLPILLLMITKTRSEPCVAFDCLSQCFIFKDDTKENSTSVLQEICYCIGCCMEWINFWRFCQYVFYYILLLYLCVWSVLLKAISSVTHTRSS